MKNAFRSSVCLSLALFCGCATRPMAWSAAMTSPPPNILLIRGWGGLDACSAGIDRLFDELQAAGFCVACLREERWRDAATMADAVPASQPIVLIGYSFGGDDVIRVARQLQANGRRVALLITIDPVTPPAVPANVDHAVDFYESNPPWDRLPWLRGVPLRGAAPIDDFDLKRNRRDLLQPGENHRTIAANPRVHAEIIADVHATLGWK